MKTVCEISYSTYRFCSLGAGRAPCICTHKMEGLNSAHTHRVRTGLSYNIWALRQKGWVIFLHTQQQVSGPTQSEISSFIQTSLAFFSLKGLGTVTFDLSALLPAHAIIVARIRVAGAWSKNKANYNEIIKSTKKHRDVHTFLYIVRIISEYLRGKSLTSWLLKFIKPV